MIALPGLTLATGGVETAKNILLVFAQSVSQGMLPNRWPDVGEVPEYNTADATLWFIEAVGALVRLTGDYNFLRSQLFDTLNSIMDCHVRGTRFGIRVHENGLLACGESGSQLTWMDAKVDGVAVTPRIGMPVEIQALWYNALRTMEHFSQQTGDFGKGENYGVMAIKAHEAFQSLFWNDKASCLYDVVDADSRDASIRPNQIFAISLTYPLITGERACQVVDRVQRDLLTPYGLRTLSPQDSRYTGRCEGGPSVRDTAYHQGTVWPWLLGPFITAYLRVHSNNPEAVEQGRVWLHAVEEHLREAGLGQISEIFDGDPPHHPRGCIAQAWSVGETLRVLLSIQQLSQA
jgi:predicted glycogen debranching enzyme